MKVSKVIDATVESWSTVHPDLDFAGMGVLLKLSALAQRLNMNASEMAESCGITLGEFDVLATLRRNGPGAKLTPTFIAEVALVSPSGLTHRLTQLEKAGHIVRHPDPSDRRSSLISITKSGAALADRIVTHIAETGNDLLATLSPARVQSIVRDIEILLQPVSRNEVEAERV